MLLAGILAAALGQTGEKIIKPDFAVYGTAFLAKTADGWYFDNANNKLQFYQYYRQNTITSDFDTLTLGDIKSFSYVLSADIVGSRDPGYVPHFSIYTTGCATDWYCSRVNYEVPSKIVPLDDGRYLVSANIPGSFVPTTGENVAEKSTDYTVGPAEDSESLLALAIATSSSAIPQSKFTVEEVKINNFVFDLAADTATTSTTGEPSTTEWSTGVHGANYGRRRRPNASVCARHKPARADNRGRLGLKTIPVPARSAKLVPMLCCRSRQNPLMC
jgi:hypothetical protein